MIEEFTHVIGENDERTTIGIAVHVVRYGTKERTVFIEEDETNEVYIFRESEVRPYKATQ